MAAVPIRATVTGLVLAGGEGRRMGGVDKGLELLDGRPLVAWASERLQSQVSMVLINANRNGAEYARYGENVVADRIEGFVGPLAGLQAGLEACSTELLASVPCDTPFFPADLVRRLHEALRKGNAALAVVRAGGRLHPLCALMRRDVLPDLTRFLAEGGRKVQVWAASLDAVAVDFEDADAFANINTPEDLTNRRGAADA